MALLNRGETWSMTVCRSSWTGCGPSVMTCSMRARPYQSRTCPTGNRIGCCDRSCRKQTTCAKPRWQMIISHRHSIQRHSKQSVVLFPSSATSDMLITTGWIVDEIRQAFNLDSVKRMTSLGMILKFDIGRQLYYTSLSTQCFRSGITWAVLNPSGNH